MYKSTVKTSSQPTGHSFPKPSLNLVNRDTPMRNKLKF